MTRVRCVDPDSHDYPGGGRIIAATNQEVAYRHEVEVPDDVAGRAPSGKPGDDDYDPGEGLLAQSDVWHVARAKKDAEKETD